MYHIVFNADENYIKYASVLITNIIHKINKTNNCAPMPLCFHILTNCLSQDTQDKLNALEDSTLQELYPFCIKIYNIDETLFAGLPTLNGNYSAYWRLLIGRMLPLDVACCLYLDVDMLVMCDVREILNLQFSAPLCAVPDFGRYAGRILEPKSNAKPITFSKKYFNSGFLLFNLEQWRALNAESQCFSILQNYHLRFHDQDILNAVFIDIYQPLPFSYDYIAQSFGASVCQNESKKHYNIHHTRAEFNALTHDIKVLHYCAEKPWRTLVSYVFKGEFITQLWWQYAEITPIFAPILAQEKLFLKQDCKPYLVGVAILNANGFGFLKLPFIIQNILNKDTSINISINKALQDPHFNRAYELGKLAIRIATSSKKVKYFTLILRILRAKIRYKN